MEAISSGQHIRKTKQTNSGEASENLHTKAFLIRTEGQKVFMSAGNCLMSIRTHKHYVTVPIFLGHTML